MLLCCLPRSFFLFAKEWKWSWWKSHLLFVPLHLLILEKSGATCQTGVCRILSGQRIQLEDWRLTIWQVKSVSLCEGTLSGDLTKALTPSTIHQNVLLSISKLLRPHALDSLSFVLVFSSHLLAFLYHNIHLVRQPKIVSLSISKVRYNSSPFLSSSTWTEGYSQSGLVYLAKTSSSWVLLVPVSSRIISGRIHLIQIHLYCAYLARFLFISITCRSPTEQSKQSSSAGSSSYHLDIMAPPKGPGGGYSEETVKKWVVLFSPSSFEK